MFAFSIGPAYIDSVEPSDGIGLDILPKCEAGVEREVPFSACNYYQYYIISETFDASSSFIKNSMNV